jgi:hypothetical protein
VQQAPQTVTVTASQTKTGLAVMSPWHLRPAVEPNLTDAQRLAFEDRMVADPVEAKVKLVRLEIAASGESVVDTALYRRLIDKLPADVKVICAPQSARAAGMPCQPCAQAHGGAGTCPLIPLSGVAERGQQGGDRGVFVGSA